MLNCPSANASAAYTKCLQQKVPPRTVKDLPPLKVGVRGSTMDRVHMPDVTILTKAEYDRLQYQLNKRQLEAEKIRAAEAERRALHELSQEKVKTWSNTVLGTRQKKLDARKAREEREEQERVLLDIEEAKIQAQQRRDVIEKAKCQLYYETDRVKGFHTAIRLAEVLKERDAQLELNEIKRGREKQGDICWGEKIRQDYLDSIEQNNEENRVRREKIDHTVKFQLGQIERNRQLREQEKEEDAREGEQMRRDAERYREEERCRAEQRAEEAKKKSLENRRQIEDIEYMRHIEKLKEEEEDEECRMFAAAKKKMMLMRMEKEQELENERQARLDRIREKLASQIKEQVNDEEARLNRAMEEEEEKKRKENEEKEMRRQKAQRAIEEHRIEEAKQRQKQAEEQKAADVEMLKARMEASRIFAANELEKLRKRREEAVKFSKYYLEDSEERRRKTKRERDQELEQYQRDLDLALMDEAQFQDYARRVIDHLQQRGRNVLPLERAARPGIGGGLGPVYPGRGPLRPSYQSVKGTELQSNNGREATEAARAAVVE